MKVASDFRREARQALKGKWMTAVLAGVVASILGAAGGSSLDFNFKNSAAEGAHVNVDFAGVDVATANIDHIMESGLGNAVIGLTSAILILALVIAVIQLIIGCVVAIGYAKFNMNLIDGREAKVGDLFDYLPQWKTMVKAGLLQTLFVFLWGLLFIIPGIVAGFRYAQTNYILAENPEMGAMEAIDRSKEMMRGNKWRLFCLGFSFIGWKILCIFTLGIGYLFLYPYQYAAGAAFYRDLTGPIAGDVLMEETVS